MQEIVRSMEGCNAVRYACYRTALKVRILQGALKMQHVSPELIAAVFERHRLSSTENCVNLESSEVEDVVSDIYFASRKETNIDFDVDLLTKLATTYVFYAFDTERTSRVSVFTVKLALMLISAGKLQEKYGYLYRQLADHNACLSRAGLHTLLLNICKLMEMIGEGTTYGYCHIRSHVEGCFAKSQGCLGVTESEFAAWVVQEPPLFGWLTTLDRLKSAELVVHDVRCSSCGTTPIRGPRYSCLKCTGYHQCQECFLLGRISSRHKLKHPVREFCVKTSNREVTRLIIELIRNKLRLCPTRTATATNVEESIRNTVSCSNETAPAVDCGSLRSTSLARRSILSDPQKELQSIISRLEEENGQLQLELQDMRGTKAERLRRHRATVESQLQRLKTLKKYLFAEANLPAQSIGRRRRMQSTPMFQPVSSRLTAVPLEFGLSPIIRQDNEPDRRALSDDENERAAIVSDNDHRANLEPAIAGDRVPDALLVSAAEQASSATSELANISEETTRIELSTWIGGGKRSELHPPDSGFSQWLGSAAPVDTKEDGYAGNSLAVSSTDNDSEIIASCSPSDVNNRDNTPSSLQRPDKHSQHSSLQNVQGDLNDILDRLQNMVANDCLLDESYVAADNCKLKRATTEMEDLLTDLIEGMESRGKSKLTTVV